jgi:hypothetical protein
MANRVVVPENKDPISRVLTRTRWPNRHMRRSATRSAALAAKKASKHERKRESRVAPSALPANEE